MLPFDESVVAGVYMDRSLKDFVRACEVYIQEETRRLDCDSHLIAMLCDAVRLTREMTLMAERADGQRRGQRTGEGRAHATTDTDVSPTAARPRTVPRPAGDETP